MPRRDAAATSIVLTPAPARTISDSCPASSIGFGDLRASGRRAPARRSTRERRRQRVVLQVRLVDDLAAEACEAVDAGLLELVGDENVSWTALR